MRPSLRLSVQAQSERRELLAVLRPHLGGVPTDDGEVYLTTREVALLLQVNPATVRRWTNLGRLDARRSLGGHRMFPLSGIRETLLRLGKHEFPHDGVHS